MFLLYIRTKYGQQLEKEKEKKTKKKQILMVFLNFSRQRKRFHDIEILVAMGQERYNARDKNKSFNFSK